MTICIPQQEISACENKIQKNESGPAIRPQKPSMLIHLRETAAPANSARLSEDVLIERISREQNEEAVIKMLCAGIVKYSKLQQFTLAERLRKKLVEIAPMALTEIVRSSEILEQEQSAAMDPQKMIPFANLYNNFTQSESAAFYFALKELQAKANQPLFEQCKHDNRLYFIQSGRLILSYYDCENRQNIDFAILQKGDIAGTDAFLTLTSHGTTLTPIEDSIINYLGKGAYEEILKEHPTIRAKLFHFCETHKKVCRIDSSKRQARRSHKRYPTSLIGQIQKINAQGKVEDDISNITVTDISSGGLCYMVQNMKGNDAKLLHKRHILIQTSYKIGPVIRAFKKLAKVVSVKFYPFGECSVHVQFKNPIEEGKIMEIVKNNPTTQ